MKKFLLVLLLLFPTASYSQVLIEGIDITWKNPGWESQSNVGCFDEVQYANGVYLFSSPDILVSDYFRIMNYLVDTLGMEGYTDNGNASGIYGDELHDLIYHGQVKYEDSFWTSDYLIAVTLDHEGLSVLAQWLP